MAKKSRHGALQQFDPTVLTSPLLIGCTRYTLLFDMPPWGVAQSDLFRAPHSLLFPDALLCDTSAVEAENIAAEEMNWVSSALFMEAIDKGLITTKNFTKPIKQLRNIHQSEVNPLIDSIRNGDDPLRATRILDAKFSDWLLGSPDTTKKQGSPLQAFYYNEAGKGTFNPGWTKTPGVVIGEVFLDPDFYLLPPLNPTKAPTDIRVPPEVQRAVIEVNAAQRPHLADLSALRISQPMFIQRIKHAHGKQDQIIDRYLRTQRDREGRDFHDRLDFIIEIRRKLHKTPVMERMLFRLRQWYDDQLTKAEMVEALDDEVSAELGYIISFRRRNRRSIKMSLLVALTSTSALGVFLHTLSPQIVPAGVYAVPPILGGLAVGAWQNVAHTMLRMWNLPDEFPLGYLRGGSR